MTCLYTNVRVPIYEMCSVLRNIIELHTVYLLLFFFQLDKDDSEVFLERTLSENELDISGMEQLHQIPDNSQAEESWENLHEVSTCTCL